MKNDKRFRCEACKSRYNPKNERRRLRQVAPDTNKGRPGWEEQ